MEKHSIEEAYEQSIAQLLKNSTEYGLAASLANHEGTKKNYAALYSRDVGICSLGILASENKELIKILKKSLQNLASFQSSLGQIPFYVKPEKKEVQWRQTGSIDGTIWWCIAFLKYYKYSQDHEFYHWYKENLERAFTWLLYQDTNNDSLVEQGEAADWADEMPRQGTVLYANALWYWLVKLRIELEGKKEYNTLLIQIYEAFNSLFWIRKGTSSNFSYIPDNSFTKNNLFAKQIIEYTNSKAVYLPYYLGYVSHKNFEMRCEVFGNILACLVGLADEEKAELITDFIKRSAINRPYPIKALYPPIYPGEQDFKDYMTKGRQNYPWQYHNGGVWPMVGGFWVQWLSYYDKNLATEELEKLAQVNKINNWEFNEYFHGEYGTPLGVMHQSWNMGMYIAAYKEIY